MTAKKQINIRVSNITAAQLDTLIAKWGTSITETVTVLVDRAYREETMNKSAYRSGHAAGASDAVEQTGQRGEQASTVQSVEDALGSGMTPEQASDYWLGYYHGRYQARTGEPSEGQEARTRRS